MKNLCGITMLVVVMLSGCATVQPEIILQQETAGLAEEVHKTATSISTPEGTTSTSSQETTQVSPAMFELKLKMAKLQAAQAATIAAALANPCGGFNPPAGCIYQQGIGGSYSQGAGGANITFGTNVWNGGTQRSGSGGGSNTTWHN